VTPYECSTCGACCNAFIVDVSVIDASWIPEELLDTDRHGHYQMACSAKTRDGSGTCAAWEGDLGVSSSCTLYGSRPSTCVEFPYQPADCDRARRRVGLPIVERSRT
jgi:Fe-S-cluster containining protein